jgi:hypothetical protein
MSEKPKLKPSAIEFDFDDDAICAILEKHVRDTIGHSNANDIIAYKSDGGYFVAVWTDGSYRVQTMEPIVLSEK